MLSPLVPLLLCAALQNPPAPGTRSVVEAIPAGASMALYLPRVSGNIEASVDLMALFFGASNARTFLERAPLPRLALRASDGGEKQGLDPSRGIGLFKLPGFSGAVGVVGVSDEARALAATAQAVRADGGRPQGRPGSNLSFRMPSGATYAAFVSRGYLYLVMADAAHRDATSPSAQAVVLDSRRWAEGMNADGRFKALAGRVARGDLYGWAVAPFGPESDVEAALVSATLHGDALTLEGFATVRGGTWQATDEEVDGSSAGPGMGRACLAAPLPRLAELALGPNASVRRQNIVGKAKLLGVDLEAALAALKTPAVLRAFSRAADGTSMSGIELHTGVVSRDAASALVSTLLARLQLPVLQDPGATADRFTTALGGSPIVIDVGADHLLLRGGDGRPHAATTAVPACRTGHLAFALDLRGADDALTALLLEESGEDGQVEVPFDTAWLDVAPEEGGLRLEGRLSFEATAAATEAKR